MLIREEIMRAVPLRPDTLPAALSCLATVREDAANWHFVLALVTELLRQDDVEKRGTLLVARLRSRTGDQRMVVLTLQGDCLRSIAGEDLPDGAENVVIPVVGTLCDHLRTGLIIHAADARAGVLRRLGVSTLVPAIGRNGQIVMAIGVCDQHVSLDLIRDVCGHVGVAFEGTHSARALYTPGIDPRDPALHARLASAWTTDSIAHTLALEACAAAAARRATVLVARPEGDGLVVRGATGLGQKGVEDRLRRGEEIGIRFGRGRGGPARAWETGRSTWDTDTTRQIGVLSVPLIHEERVAGVLTLHWYGRDVPRSPDRILEVLVPIQITGAACLARAIRLDSVVVNANTGLPNEAVWSNRAAELAVRASRQGNALAIATFAFQEPPQTQQWIRVASRLRGALWGIAELGQLDDGRVAAVLPGLNARECVAVLRAAAAEVEGWRPAVNLVELKPGLTFSAALAKLKTAGVAGG